MKLKKFKFLFRGLQSDTKIMVVDDWLLNGLNYGHPLLGAANAYTLIRDEPQGWEDDGSLIAYIWHDSHNKNQDITLKKFRKLIKELPPDTEIMVVIDWMQHDEQGYPFLGSANSTYLIEHELEWDNDNDRILYIYSSPD